MTTAFVLSGGGNLGAVQVGMLQALADRAIVPDLLVGTSVGALNAAYLAAGPSPARIAELAEIWRGVRRRDVFPTSMRSLLGAVRGTSSGLVDPRPLRRLLERCLPYERIEDAPWPLAVVGTEVETGREVLLTRGSVVDAVMASASIPAVFPPVALDGHVLMDGGVVNNTPITAAQQLGATVAYVLPTGYACALPEPPRSALGMALHAVAVGLQQRLIAEVAALQHSLTLHVVPPLCPVSVSPTDFSHAAELIDAARESTRRWLDRPRAADQGSVLGLHTHRPVATAQGSRGDGQMTRLEPGQLATG
jgi:NTE family protein